MSTTTRTTSRTTSTDEPAVDVDDQAPVEPPVEPPVDDKGSPSNGDRPPTTTGASTKVEQPQLDGSIEPPAQLDDAAKKAERNRKARERRAAKKAQGGGTATQAPRSRTAGAGALHGKLVELVTTVGTLLVTAGAFRPALGYDGQIVLAQAAPIADELVKLGKRNPAVQRALQQLVTTSEMGGSLLVLGAVLLPILANHGVIPPATAILVGAPLPPPRPPREPRAKKGAKVDDPAPTSTAPVDQLDVDERVRSTIGADLDETPPVAPPPVVEGDPFADADL